MNPAVYFKLGDQSDSTNPVSFSYNPDIHATMLQLLNHLSVIFCYTLFDEETFRCSKYTFYYLSSSLRLDKSELTVSNSYKNL